MQHSQQRPNRQRKRKQKSSAGLRVLGAVLLVAGVALFWRELIIRGILPEFAWTSEPLADSLPTHLAWTGEMVDTPIAQLADTGLLVLVNGAYAVTDEPALSDLSSAYRVVPVRVAEMYLRAEALAAVDALFDAAAADGIDNLVFSSGFRTADEQARIYADSADKSFVQPSGHSEHQTGLAADIFALGVSEAAMPDSREGQWLAANAADFGLILRYPAGKEDITGIAYEPWHFRFVGAPHAAYCAANDMTYEEYLDALRTSGGYEMKSKGVNYTVLYQRAERGHIQTPAGGNWTISNDNLGGYIVTIWE